MRIIAGALKGRRLTAPAWSGLRPTSDKLRETLFNILAPRISGARVLDGYAGTGAIGIEAISRGASHVTFVERDPRAAALVAENLRRCGVRDGYAIIRADLRAALARGQLSRDALFEIILLDPPYDEANLETLVQGAGARLAAGGLLALEHARRREVPSAAGDVERSRVVTSGDSALTFYRRASSTADAPPERRDDRDA